MHRLEPFGSATSDDLDLESSDLDFLVAFLLEADAAYFGTYHLLYWKLSNLFDRPAGFVTENKLRDPDFRQAVERTWPTAYGP